MTTSPEKTPAKQAPPSPKKVCANCRHPQPFHSASGCNAFGCNTCTGFQSMAAVRVEQPKPRDLNEYITREPGLQDALMDASRGHRSIVKQFPLTSETSVRRWRKCHGVVLDG